MAILHYQGSRFQEAFAGNNENATRQEEKKSIIRKTFHKPPDLLRESLISLPLDEIYQQYTRFHLLQGQEGALYVPPDPDRRLTAKSFLALSTTYFGVEHGERASFEHGLLRYGRALRELNSVLGDRRQHLSLDLLESVVLLALFEFFLSESQDGWVGHSVGLERLMELRGPESFSKPPELRILESARPSIIFASLTVRKRTIFARHDWKHIPWSTYPALKSGEQVLVDILADAPDFFVDKFNVDEITDLTMKHAAYKDLAHRVGSSLVQLEQWEKVWNLPSHFESTPPATAPLINNLDGTSQPIWSSVFQFESLGAVHIFAQFNATFLLFARLHRDLWLASGEPFTDQMQIEQRMHSAGIAICRCIDYYTESMRQGAGSLYSLFPIRMAYEAVGSSNPVIGDWIRNILHHIASGSTGRWSMAKYLLNVPPVPQRRQPTT
jgi:hypothetical protein